MEDARQLQQRGVADGVVADADIPGIDMAMDQHKALRLDIPLDLGHQAGTFEPALFQQRMQGGMHGCVFHLREQLIAVGAIDGDDRDARLALVGIQVGRAPDGGADAPVDIDAGVDEDAALGALVLEVPDRRRAAEAVHDHDFAGAVDIAEGREVEEIGAAPGGEAFDAHAFPADAFGRAC